MIIRSPRRWRTGEDIKTEPRIVEENRILACPDSSNVNAAVKPIPPSQSDIDTDTQLIEKTTWHAVFAGNDAAQRTTIAAPQNARFAPMGDTPGEANSDGSPLQIVDSIAINGERAGFTKPSRRRGLFR